MSTQEQCWSVTRKQHSQHECLRSHSSFLGTETTKKKSLLSASQQRAHRDENTQHHSRPSFSLLLSTRPLDAPPPQALPLPKVFPRWPNMSRNFLTSFQISLTRRYDLQLLTLRVTLASRHDLHLLRGGGREGEGGRGGCGALIQEHDPENEHCLLDQDQPPGKQSTWVETGQDGNFFENGVEE